MAVTLEFWKNRSLNIVYVQYNKETYKMRDFINLPESKEIIEKIYQKIVHDYPYDDTGDKYETVGKFINKHFLDYDKKFDIVILGASERQTVIFNFEDE